MADFLQKYPLVNGTPQKIDSSNVKCVAYDFTNDSPFDVDIQWGSGKPISLTVPPTTLWRGVQPSQDLLVGGVWNGIIIATPSYPIGGMQPNGAPAQQLTVHGYQKGNAPQEQIMSLNRLQNIGNTVPIGGSVQSITNQNETPPQNVIFDQPTGYSSPSIVLVDTGAFLLAPETNGSFGLDAFQVVAGGGAGVYAVVKMDNAKIATDGQGNLTAQSLTTIGSVLVLGANLKSSGTLTVVGASSQDNGNMTTDGAGNLTAKHLSATQLADSGTLAVTGSSSLDNGTMSTNGAGVLSFTAAHGAANQNFILMEPSDLAGAGWRWEMLANGNLVLVDNATSVSLLNIATQANGSGLKLTNVGNFIIAWSFFTGNASGTYSHGLGTTPNVVLLNASAVGSETLGWDSATSTQVHITNGASVAWTALALRMV